MRDGLRDEFEPIFAGGEGSKLSDKWGWYSTIFHLAQGDLLRIESVTRVPVREAFTFLCYELDLDILKRNKMPHDT